MKLERVFIYNFRSIEEQTLDLTTPFRILVGKNESGKSNILKALSLLRKEAEIREEDIREGVDVEAIDSLCKVNFEFTFDYDEVEEIYKTVRKEVYTDDSDFDSLKICKIGEKDYTLVELLMKFNTALYSVHLSPQERIYQYWTNYSNTWKILSNRFKYHSPTSKRPNDYSGFKLIDTKDMSDELKMQFVNLDGEKLNSVVGSSFIKVLQEKHPEVINWTYNENDLLSENIDIDAFINNPDDFRSLKIMFELAGVKNVKESLANKKQGKNFHQLNNYLDKIAKSTTEHFRNVWKEYKEVEFTLNINGNEIVSGIKEVNTYTLQQRSDGFKRFVTFLLIISAAYETENLNNALLLIDEPDVSLHPSGIRFLRDELIKISTQNKIVASTHSIFLIDNKLLERHYIVKKENEITTIETAVDENLVSEEVLFNALGFSFYEVLSKQNIVFEGWRDKELFKKALERVPNEYKEVKILKDISTSHINGVKGAKGIVPIFELTGRSLLIVSDCDEVAIQHKKDFEKEKSYGTWKTYHDISNQFEGKTCEDFFKIEFIKSSFEDLMKVHPELDGICNFENTNSFLDTFEDWLKSTCNVTDKTKRKILANEFKDILFNNIKSTSIDNKYYTFLIELNSLTSLLFKN